MRDKGLELTLIRNPSMYDLVLDPKKYFEYMKKPMEEKWNAVDQKWKAVDQTSFED